MRYLGLIAAALALGTSLLAAPPPNPMGLPEGVDMTVEMFGLNRGIVIIKLVNPEVRCPDPIDLQFIIALAAQYTPDEVLDAIIFHFSE